MRTHPLRPSLRLKGIYGAVAAIALTAYIFLGNGETIAGLSTIILSTVTLGGFFITTA